jgi:hypothetical protein
VVPAGVRVAGNSRDGEKSDHSSDSKPATMRQHLSQCSSDSFLPRNPPSAEPVSAPTNSREAKD